MLQALPQLTLVWLDGSGSTAETRITIKSNLPVATIESAATGLVAALSACTDAVFISQSIVYKFVPETEQIGDIGSDKFRAGVFIFECTEPGDMGLISLVSIREDKLLPDGPGAGVLINQSDADVIAFLDVATNGAYTNPFAVPLETLSAAYMQSRV